MKKRFEIRSDRAVLTRNFAIKHGFLIPQSTFNPHKNYASFPCLHVQVCDNDKETSQCSR